MQLNKKIILFSTLLFKSFSNEIIPLVEIQYIKIGIFQVPNNNHNNEIIN